MQVPGDGSVGKRPMSEQLPYAITPDMLSRVARIGEAIAWAGTAVRQDRRLRRINRIRTIPGSLGSFGRQRVQTECFRDFSISLPPRSLQTRFDSYCEAVFRQIECLSAQSRKLIQARDLLRPRLMNREFAV